jgi:hypothetical protein
MAEDYFEHHGKVEKWLLAVTADGEQLHCVAGWPDDAAEAETLAEVRTVYRARGVSHYGVVAEVWLGQGPVRPLKDPARVEAVMLALIGREPGQRLVAVREIVRPWDGSKPTLGPLKRLDGDGPASDLLALLDY